LARKLVADAVQCHNTDARESNNTIYTSSTAHKHYRTSKHELNERVYCMYPRTPTHQTPAESNTKYHPLTHHPPKQDMQRTRNGDESQRIVATRLLCRLQYPVTLESSARAPALQVQQLGFADQRVCRLRRAGEPRCSTDSGLEAFSHDPADGSVAALAARRTALPSIRINGSSRTLLNCCSETQSVG